MLGSKGLRLLHIHNVNNYGMPKSPGTESMQPAKTKKTSNLQLISIYFQIREQLV